MKNIAGLVLVLLTAVESQAQLKKMYQSAKQAVTGSATLAQLHYFPEQWEVDLALGYRYSVLNVKGNSTGTTIVEADQSTSTMTTALTVGLLDNVYAQLKWDYLVSFNVDYSKPQAQPDTKSKGAEDPTIGATIRLVDADSVKLDAKAEFQPSGGDHLEADATHDGNAKSGGHATTLGARFVALVTDSSQISATLDYKILSLQNSMDQSTGIFSEDDKHNQMTIELATMTELTSNLFFGVMLDIVNIDSYKSTNLSSQAVTDYGSTSGKTLNLIGRYEATQDSLIEAQVGYILDYSQEVGAVDISATGYSMAVQYTIRF